MAIRGLVFDVDGLIFDTERVWQRAFVDANARFSTEFDETMRVTWMGRKDSEIRDELNRNFPELDSEGYRAHMCSFVNNCLNSGDFSVKTGFENIVAYAREKGLKLGIATGNELSVVKMLFEKAGLDLDNFVVTCSCEVDKGKPDPAVYLLSAQKLGLSPEEIVVLEDAPSGIVSASKAGCKPIMVVDLAEPTEELQKICLAVCYDLNEACSVLEKIFAGEGNA